MMDTCELIPADDVCGLLCALGAAKELRGYRYLSLAAELAVQVPERSVNEILVIVAERFSVTVSSAESAMRKVIADSWSRDSDLAFRAKVFGNTVQFSRGKPSLREYITQIAGYVCMKRSGLL